MIVSDRTSGIMRKNAKIYYFCGVVTLELQCPELILGMAVIEG